MHKRLRLFCWLCSVLLVSFLFVGCTSNGEEAETKPVTLKLVTFSNVEQSNWAVYEFVKRVNEQGEGLLTIDMLGGPEAISATEQPRAVRTGVVDIGVFCASFYLTELPEAELMILSEIEPWEERENGLFDLMVELHKEKMNARYLGRAQSHLPFMIYTVPKVEKLDDLIGMKIVDSPAYDLLLKRLEMAPINVPIVEMYDSLQRHVTDASMTPPQAALQYKMHEVCNYIIPYGVWPAQNIVVLANLDSWNKLSKEQQDLIDEIMAELERDMVAYWDKVVNDSLNELIENGLTPVDWPKEDQERYHAIAQEAKWDQVESVGKSDPEVLNRMKVLLDK